MAHVRIPCLGAPPAEGFYTSEVAAPHGWQLRIYLAGFREGAALAYRLALLYPEKFAGVISLNGAMPRRGCPLLRLPEARGLRVMIGHGIANPIVPLTLARQDYRVLSNAGLQV